MTYKEACSFFSRHGNVSTQLDRLQETLPTRRQLEAACLRALSSGTTLEVIQAAKDAVVCYWETKGEKIC